MHSTRVFFKYTPSSLTDIRATFARFGFRPTTDAERRARQQAVDREGCIAGEIEKEEDPLRRTLPLD